MVSRIESKGAAMQENNLSGEFRFPVTRLKSAMAALDPQRAASQQRCMDTLSRAEFRTGLDGHRATRRRLPQQLAKCRHVRPRRDAHGKVAPPREQLRNSGTTQAASPQFRRVTIDDPQPGGRQRHGRAVRPIPGNQRDRRTVDRQPAGPGGFQGHLVGRVKGVKQPGRSMAESPFPTQILDISNELY